MDSTTVDSIPVNPFAFAFEFASDSEAVDFFGDDDLGPPTYNPSDAFYRPWETECEEQELSEMGSQLGHAG